MAQYGFVCIFFGKFCSFSLSLMLTIFFSFHFSVLVIWSELRMKGCRYPKHPTNEVISSSPSISHSRNISRPNKKHSSLKRSPDNRQDLLNPVNMFYDFFDWMVVHIWINFLFVFYNDECNDEYIGLILIIDFNLLFLQVSKEEHVLGFHF